MGNGLGHRIKPGSVLLFEDGSQDPLRMQDLISFLAARQRRSSCPHCSWQGGWEIAMFEENDQDENPKLEIFKLDTLSQSIHTCVAIICPNCGHFAQIATYKIREFMAEAEAKNA